MPQTFDEDTMLHWRVVLVGVFCCCIKTGVTWSRTKALFPASSRPKRGVPPVANPTFYNSFSDVHLLYEILLTGTHFEDSGAFLVDDAELASLRKTRSLDIICDEIIPKKLTDIYRLISNLSNHTSFLHQDDFERTLLTLVYTVHQVARFSEHQRDRWAESFVSLYKAIKKDLMLIN
ncbi:protein FAM180A [Pholidichthys leucotaenia]